MSGPMYRINLLPPKLQREQLVDMRRLLLMSAAAVLSVVVIGTLVGFVISNNIVKQEINSTNQQLAVLQPTVDTVQNLQSQIQTMLNTRTDYQSLLSKQMDWSTLIYKLNAIAPSDLWLTELDMSNEVLSSDPNANGTSTAFTPLPVTPSAPGANPNAQNSNEPVPYPNVITITGMANSVTSIGIFAQNLNQLPYFKNVVINTIGSQTGTGSQDNGLPAQANTFQITAYLR